MPGSYVAPTLTTVLDSTGYRSEMDSNFSLIQQALIDIQNAIPSFGGRVTAGMLTLVDTLGVPSGVVGTDSFVPGFSTDSDAVDVFHNAPGGISSCVIGSRYHEYSTAWSKNLSEVVLSDGTYEVALGARSLGSPAMELLLELEDTDKSQELTFFSMDVTRSGSSYSVANLRRVAPVLASRDSFTKVFEFHYPLTFHVAGALPTVAGDVPVGVVVPWDARVESAWFRLATAPDNTDGVTVELRDAADTDGSNVLASAATWSAGEDGRAVQVAGNGEPTIVAAGTFLRLWIAVPDGSGVAADLSCTVLLRRIYHDIL